MGKMMQLKDSKTTFASRLRAFVGAATSTDSFNFPNQLQMFEITEIITAFIFAFSEIIEIAKIVEIIRIIDTDLVVQMGFTCSQEYCSMVI